MYDVYETCPHCDCENHYKWYFNKGYVGTCLECGKEVMLCTECPLLEKGVCDWSEEKNCSKYNTHLARLKPLAD